MLAKSTSLMRVGLGFIFSSCQQLAVHIDRRFDPQGGRTSQSQIRVVYLLQCVRAAPLSCVIATKLRQPFPRVSTEHQPLYARPRYIVYPEPMGKLLSIPRGLGDQGATARLSKYRSGYSSIIQTPGQGLVKSWMSGLLFGYGHSWTMPILWRSEATIPGPIIGCPVSSISF
jgi:hypothetical protein